MRKRSKWTIAAFAVMLLLVGGFVFINANLRPVLVGLASARVQSAAAKAMNDAILEVVADGYDYDTLIQIRATESKVYLLQANSARLNVLAADCANSAQGRITEMGEQGISVPLGTITGIPLLAGRGPRIAMRFTPAGAVKSSFDSEFRSAGINQTLHRINLKLIATVRVILPGESHTLTVEVTAPIAENIIVGDVPDAYTNVANEADLLNLVPGD
ncbi:MAG: sporulation protein YunB [Clostridia bacterium]